MSSSYPVRHQTIDYPTERAAPGVSTFQRSQLFAQGASPPSRRSVPQDDIARVLPDRVTEKGLPKPGQLEADLDCWMIHYNDERIHQGKARLHQQAVFKRVLSPRPCLLSPQGSHHRRSAAAQQRSSAVRFGLAARACTLFQCWAQLLPADYFKRCSVYPVLMPTTSRRLQSSMGIQLSEECWYQSTEANSR